MTDQPDNTELQGNARTNTAAAIRTNESTTPAPAEGWQIQNLTDRRIGISYKDTEPGSNVFVLPPFGKRSITNEQYANLLIRPWVERNLVRTSDIKKEVSADRTSLALGCVVWIFIIGLILGLVIPALRSSIVYWIGFGVVILGVPLAVWMSGPGRIAYQITVQNISLLLILVISVGLPALVIYLYSDVHSLVVKTPPELNSLVLLGRGLQLLFIVIVSLLPSLLYYIFDRQRLGTLRESFYRNILILDPTIYSLDDARSLYGERVDEVYGPEDSTGQTARLLDRTRVPILIATLVITLGWIMVFLPIGTLDVPLSASNIADLFLPRLTPLTFGFLGAYFFSINMILRRYLRSDLKPKAYTHITVRILTVIILVWALSMLPTITEDVSTGFTSLVSRAQATPQPTSAAESAPTEGTQTPVPETAEATPVPAVANPVESAAAALNEVLDTTPASQNAPTTGGFSPLFLLFVFLVGIVPETGLAAIQEYFQNTKWLVKRVPSMEETLPLNHLEGIDLYERARLMEEGIDNIQNLVNNDLVDLMLQLRVPLPRLLDWIDQGILYLHLTTVSLESRTPVRENQETAEPASQADDPLLKLRYYGIRTASDLETAYQAALERDQKTPKEVAGRDEGQPVGISAPTDHAVEAPAGQAETESPLATEPAASQPTTTVQLTETERFLSLLDAQGAAVQRLRIILDTLADDDWLPYIRRWRQPSRYSRELLLKADVFVIDEQQKFGLKIVEEFSTQSNLEQ